MFEIVRSPCMMSAICILASSTPIKSMRTSKSLCDSIHVILEKIGHTDRDTKLF